MARTQIKIVVFLAALAFLATSVLVAVWFVVRDYRVEKATIAEIEDIYEAPPPPPDAGLRTFKEAVGLMEADKLPMARLHLLRLIEESPDSVFVGPARRILGEIHMDQLLSRRPMPGKLDYQVRRGDALAAIARRNGTTIEYIRRVNGLDEGSVIHPGDRLVVFPLEFEIEVDLGAESLTLLHEGAFFKEYALAGYRLPESLRIPIRMKVSAKSAWVGDERISATDGRIVEARKWIQCLRPGSSFGLALTSEQEGADPSEVPGGLFLDPSDLEELFTILREGTIVTVTR